MTANLDNNGFPSFLVLLQVAITEQVNSRWRILLTFVSTKTPSCNNDKRVAWSDCLVSSISSMSKNLGGFSKQRFIMPAPVDADARAKYDKSGYSFSMAFKNLVFPIPAGPTNRI